jgi:hypothetical protein
MRRIASRRAVQPGGLFAFQEQAMNIERALVIVILVILVVWLATRLV